MLVNLSNLKRFFPYESIHACDSLVVLDDKDGIWHRAITTLLSKYEPDAYFGCSVGYFALEFDNKITLELRIDDRREPIYITYWDNTVSISTSYTVWHKEMYCTVKTKIS